ncbi:MAG: hypothetical protein Q8L66_02180 [Caulobacter sp.]|nr:hypothetical protein [Caulobacter sp.]
MLISIAVLGLVLGSALPALAMASEQPCPMESSGMDPAWGQMDCCDHDMGGTTHKSPCKPGATCQASVLALPASSLVVSTFSVGAARPDGSLPPPLSSHPADRTLRPPIAA